MNAGFTQVKFCPASKQKVTVFASVTRAGGETKFGVRI